MGVSVSALLLGLYSGGPRDTSDGLMGGCPHVVGCGLWVVASRRERRGRRLRREAVSNTVCEAPAVF
jgi:hypothetical protein